jgi:hypothetical protein
VSCRLCYRAGILLKYKETLKWRGMLADKMMLRIVFIIV